MNKEEQVNKVNYENVIALDITNSNSSLSTEEEQPTIEDTPVLVCKTCFNHYTKNYCNFCGQKRISRLDFRSIGGMLYGTLFDLDEGLIFTIKSLALRPGKAIAEYLSGATKRYYNPIKFLLLILSLLLIFETVTDGLTPIDTSLIYNSNVAFSIKAYEDWQEFSQSFFSSYFNLYFAITIPFCSFLSWILFKKSKFNYGEQIVFFCYLSGFFMILSGLFVATFSLLDILFDSSNVFTTSVYLLIILLITYLGHWLKSFFKESLLSTIWKGIVTLYGGTLLSMVFQFFIFNLLKIIKS